MQSKCLEARYTDGVTKYESVLTQALDLDEEDRELLVLQVSLSLEGGPDPLADPRLIQELDRRVQHAREHPETALEWKEAELAIFGRNDE